MIGWEGIWYDFLMQNYSIVFGGFHWDVNQCLFTQIRHRQDKTIPFLSILVNWSVYGSLYLGSWMTKKQVPYRKTHPSVHGNVWMFHSMEFLVLITCTYTAEINFTSTSVLCLSNTKEDILWILEFLELSQSCKFLCLLGSMRLFHAKKKIF